MIQKLIKHIILCYNIALKESSHWTRLKQKISLYLLYVVFIGRKCVIKGTGKRPVFTPENITQLPSCVLLLLNWLHSRHLLLIFVDFGGILCNFGLSVLRLHNSKYFPLRIKGMSWIWLKIVQMRDSFILWLFSSRPYFI